MERNGYSQQIEFLAIEAFKSDGFLIVNKVLISKLGLIPAVLLSNYIDKHIYFKEKFPDADGWFYLPHERVQEQLQLAEFSVRKAKAQLMDLNIVEIKRKGIPAKEWIRIDFVALTEAIKPLKGLVLSKTAGLDLSKTAGHNIKDTILKDNKIIIKKIIPPKKEWIVEYCQERKNTIDAEQFYDFYASKGWRIGKQRMQDWQAAVRTWEKNSSKNEKKKPDWIMYDGRRYRLGKDGLYRNADGDIHYPEKYELV